MRLHTSIIAVLLLKVAHQELDSNDFQISPEFTVFRQMIPYFAK